MTTHWKWTAAATAVVAGAVVLRTITLPTKPLSFDETYSIFIASHSIERLLALTAANEAHPPLYYLLLHWWIGLFGDGALAVRALSVPISASIVAVTWSFGRRLVGPAPALFAAGLAAVAPSQVAVGQEARMYGLLALAALASWWALWAAVAGGGRRAWVIYVLVVAAMLYTHYYGFFVMASHAGYLLWRRAPVAIWRAWVYAGLGALAMFLPWLPALPVQLATGRAWPSFRPPLNPGLYVDTLASMTIGQFFFDAIGGGSLPRVLAWPLLAAVAPLALAGYRALPRDGDARALVVGSALFPVTLSYAVSHMVHVFAPRYLAFALPGLALLVGTGLVAIGSPGLRSARIVAVLGLVVLIAPNVASLVRYYQIPRPDVFDWRRVSYTLAARAHPDDVIIFLPGFPRIAVNYYFRGPQPRLALTPSGADVVGTGGMRMPGVIDLVSRHPRIWIVTVLPVPRSVEVLIDGLRERSYAVTRLDAIYYTRLILLERPR